MQPHASQPAQPASDGRRRFACVDLAKGIGIVLVVLWHYGPEKLGSDRWWPDFFSSAAGVVFKFHMPLFMFLSGFLFTWDAARAAPFWGAYWEHLGKKSLRLLLPYLSVSLVYVVLKLTAQRFFAYHPITWETAWNALVNPLGGPATLLWFIYCLMIVFAVFPLVQRLVRRDLPLVLLSLGLFFLFVPREKAAELVEPEAGTWPLLLAAPHWFLVDRFCRFFPLFVCGYLFRKRRLLEGISPWAGLLGSLAVFAGVSLLDPRPFLEADAAAALAGAFAGVLSCLCGAMVLERVGPLAEGLSLAGRHSAGVYLMHQPFAWFVAVVLYQKMGITGPSYLLGLPLALALGLLVPIAIENFVLSRSNLLSLAFLGVRLKTAVPQPVRKSPPPQPEPTEMARGAS